MCNKTLVFWTKMYFEDYREITRKNICITQICTVPFLQHTGTVGQMSLEQMSWHQNVWLELQRSGSDDKSFFSNDDLYKKINDC